MANRRLIGLSVLAVLSLGGCATLGGGGGSWVMGLIATAALVLSGCPTSTKLRPAPAPPIPTPPSLELVSPAPEPAPGLLRTVVREVGPPAHGVLLGTPTNGIRPGVLSSREIERLSEPPEEVRMMHSRLGPVWDEKEALRQRVKRVPTVQE